MNITIELADSQRRTVVQASPATNLEQIRIDACAKLRVDAGRYTLAEGTRLLDLNLSLRFAGIRTGSKLILVAGVAKSTPTTVRIALMVNSTREVAAFCPDDSIWAVLLHFNQTQSQCGIPVCIILNREYSGDALQASLKSAGVTSDTSMRLEFRQPQGQSLITENNLKSIEGDENSAKQTSTHDQKLRSEAQNSNAATVLPAKMSEPTVQSNSAKPPMQPSTLNLPVAAKISTLPETKLVETPTDFDRNIHYYSRPISHTPIPIFTAVDDDYTLSSTQLKSLASSMKATTNALVNQPLQTSSMRAASMNARVAKYPFSVIRVKLPDERVLQARFGSLEKDKDGNAGGFSLFVSPPIRDLDATCSFWDQGLSPAALVRFKYTALGASSYTCSLPLETMPVPAPVSVAEKSEPAPAGTKTSTMESVSVGRAMNDVPSSNNVNEKPATGRKLPKWLKLGK